MRALFKILRHPKLLAAVVRFVWLKSRDDHTASLDALRRLQTYCEQLEVKPDVHLKLKAEEAEILLRCDEPEESRDLFLSVLKACEDREDELGRHLMLFTRYWISMIDCQPYQANYWARLAKEQGLSRIGGTEVPPPFEPTDKFDEEFEKIGKELERELEKGLEGRR